MDVLPSGLMVIWLIDNNSTLTMELNHKSQNLTFKYGVPQAPILGSLLSLILPMTATYS